MSKELAASGQLSAAQLTQIKFRILRGEGYTDDEILTVFDMALSSLRGTEQCVINPVMSCVCKRGTKSCVIAHADPSRTDRQEPGLSADAETKAAYIKHFGTDAGWLGEQGSYFIEGVRVGRGDMALRSLTARDEGIELTIKAFIDRYGYNKDQYLVSMLRALKGGQP